MNVGYARVSTNDQSLLRQEQELTAAGCETVYQEKVSAARGTNRPEWDACLRALRRGDTLVVVELSRLGRSSGQLADLLDDLQDRGIELRILNLGVDTSTPAGRLVFSIISAVAQLELDYLRERTRSGLAAARQQGRVGGSKRQITDKQIKKAHQLYDEGRFSMTEIARIVDVSRPTLYRHLRFGGDAS